MQRLNRPGLSLFKGQAGAFFVRKRKVCPVDRKRTNVLKILLFGFSCVMIEANKCS